MVKFALVISVVFSLIVINTAFEIHPKIVRGYSAYSGQFPSFAFLEVQNGSPAKMSACGASLISDQWLITAAHCLQNATKLVVHLGKTVLDKPEHTHVPISVKRKNFFIFPRYAPNGVLHDIALIRLPRKVRFTEYIRPLPLPTVCKNPENVESYTVGYGATSDHSGVSPQLKFALLTTLPAHVCRQVYQNSYPGRTVICAYNNVHGQSVCRGDSGGPLVSRTDGNLIGISCFVRKDGCELGIPQGFTNVYPYLGWISYVTGMNLPKC
ncbi:collagenase-like [Sitodiplosis mosellana]|uniref:collagenase-like n=1 Tax=Sitodiplosis mosellana TaxID=263140 RepID=UPI0024449BE0|nr:collagenase-like [Sitodiplosis mosellana]